MLDVASITLGELPFRMDMCHLPATESIVTATRFKHRPVRWPHAVATYLRTSESLVPIVAKRDKQVLEWQLVDRLDKKRRVTERDLKPHGGPNPNVFFELHLLYDDTNEKVTISSLDPIRAKAIKTLAEPSVLNGTKEAMRNGRVSFSITYMHALSGMTEPRHRRFRYRLVCVDEGLKDYPHIHCDSPAFFSIAKIKKMATV
tara:strand:+ start:971 stop:1576 length:606 start_codon:yes stop_codon:yes gene_type:complete